MRGLSISFAFAFVFTCVPACSAGTHETKPPEPGATTGPAPVAVAHAGAGGGAALEPAASATSTAARAGAAAGGAAPGAAAGMTGQPRGPQPTTSAGASGGPAPTETPATPPDPQAESAGASATDPSDPGDGAGLMRGPAPTPESAARRGPYGVGRIAEGFRNGPDFAGATIFYPLDAEPPFAMIVFCPGWLGTQASDAAWGPFMASHGIVFMNIDTNTIGDSVTQRQRAESDALASLLAEHTRDGSPLAGKLALDRFGFMGWSMGGGGAWLNAKARPETKSIVTLAGHNATAGGAAPVRGLAVPTLMLAGTADTAILGLAMSQPVYDVIPDSTPKLLYEVQGASHFDFNDPAYMQGIPARYVLAWQKVYLEGDQRYRELLLQKGPNASDFRTNLE